MKVVLILVVVAIAAAQSVYAQDGSKGKSSEHKPQNPGDAADHNPQKAGGAAAIHRFRRNPMPQAGQASVGGGFQVGAGGQAGCQLGAKLRQMLAQAQQMAAQIRNKLQQFAGQGQINVQFGVNG